MFSHVLIMLILFLEWRLCFCNIFQRVFSFQLSCKNRTCDAVMRIESLVVHVVQVRHGGRAD